jgi:hypothetical protein
MGGRRAREAGASQQGPKPCNREAEGSTVLLYPQVEDMVGKSGGSMGFDF